LHVSHGLLVLWPHSDLVWGPFPASGILAAILPGLLLRGRSLPSSREGDRYFWLSPQAQRLATCCLPVPRNSV